MKKDFWEWVNEEGGKYYYFELDGKGYYACPSAARKLCGGEIKLKSTGRPRVGERLHETVREEA